MSEQANPDPNLDNTPSQHPDDLITDLDREQAAVHEDNSRTRSSEHTHRGIGRFSLRGLLTKGQDKFTHLLSPTSGLSDQAILARKGYVDTYTEEAEKAGKKFPARTSAATTSVGAIAAMERQHDELFPGKVIKDENGKPAKDKHGDIIVDRGAGKAGARSSHRFRYADKLLPQGSRAHERDEARLNKTYRDMLATENVRYAGLYEGIEIDESLASRDWSKELDPRNVIELRQAILSSLPQSSRTQAEWLLSSGGIASLNSPVTANYLGISKEQMRKIREGEVILPPNVIDKLNFMLKQSDSILERMADPTTERSTEPIDHIHSSNSELDSVRDLLHKNTAIQISLDPEQIFRYRQLDAHLERQHRREAGKPGRRQEADQTQPIPATPRNQRATPSRSETPNERLRTFYPDLFNDTTLEEASLAVEGAVQDYMNRRSSQDAPTAEELAEMTAERQEILDSFIIEGAGIDAPQEVRDAFASDLERYELSQAAEDLEGESDKNPQIASDPEKQYPPEAHDYSTDPFYGRFFEKERIRELQDYVKPAITLALKWRADKINADRVPDEEAAQIKQDVSDARTREFLAGKGADPESVDYEFIRQLTKRRLDTFQPKTKSQE